MYDAIPETQPLPQSAVPTSTVAAEATAPDPTPQHDLESFLARVVPPGYLVVAYKKPGQGMRHEFFPPDERQKAAGFIHKRTAQAYDVWYSCGSYRTAGERTQANVQALQDFWADLDVKRQGDGKQDGTVYPDQASAVRAVTEFCCASGIPKPNLIIDSGFGLHVHWTIKDAVSPDIWRPFAEGLKRALIENGMWGDLGVTTDSARILRPPETRNFKDPTNPREVKVLVWAGAIPNATMYGALAPYLDQTGRSAGARSNYGSNNLNGAPPAVMMNGASGSLLAAQAGIEKKDYSIATIATKCPQVARSLANGGAGDPYHLWYGGHLTLAHFCIDGQHYAHEISKGDPRYDPAQVDAAWQRIADEVAQKGLGAPTCTSYDGYRPGVCSGCPHSGKLNSPLSLGHAPQITIPSTTVVISGAPASQMPREMDEVTAQAELGARFSKAASYGGKPTFIRHNPDGTIERRKPEDLQVELSGHFVESVGGQGKKEQVGAARYLMNNPPRVFDRIVYDPPGSNLTRPGEVTFNLWQGFDVAPARGDWRLMRRHIWRVLCGQDAAAFKYLICWLADLVQNPGRCPEVMVILKSKLGGHGKSLLGKWLLRIFGLHGLEVTDPEQVFGEFTANLEAKSFVLLEELTFPGDHRNSAKVKALITAKTVRINGKNTPAFYVPNTLHYMVTTNEACAIAADAGARRYFVLDIKDDKPDAEGRRYYQELVAQAERGGIAAMLYDLLLVDLSKFDIRDVPVTDALIDQQRRSADDISKWIIDCVVTGEIIPGAPNGGFGAAWPPARIHQSYVTWCQAQGTRRPKVAQIFGKSLSAMGFMRSKTNNPPTWTVPDPAKLLAAVDRQEGIRKRGGGDDRGRAW
jgi:hypothetical protein